MQRLQRSIQLRYAAAYLVVTVLVLVLLNVYPLSFSQDMVIRSKETSVVTKAEMVASAMAGLDRLTNDGVEQVVNLLRDVSISRIIVTDESGLSLYDSANTDNTEGRYVVYPEIAKALGGNDVFHCPHHSHGDRERRRSAGDLPPHGHRLRVRGGERHGAGGVFCGAYSATMRNITAVILALVFAGCAP